MKILELSATELAKKIKAGEITSEEAAKASLEQIAKEDQKIRAYLTVDEEKVLARAREVDAGIRAGKYTGPLAGVPIAVKDNICTKGMKTTCASKILENFVPFYDATAVTRITDAGMVILGNRAAPRDTPRPPNRSLFSAFLQSGYRCAKIWHGAGRILSAAHCGTRSP